jgi:hypothetical protein
MPLTLEGGTIAATGFLGSLAIFKLFGAFFRRVRQRPHRRSRVHV